MVRVRSGWEAKFRCRSNFNKTRNCVLCVSFCVCVCVCVSHTNTQGDSGGKIKIFVGDNIGHGEKKVHMNVKCKVYPPTGHEGPERGNGIDLLSFYLGARRGGGSW
jgi:hypothetical protein